MFIIYGLLPVVGCLASTLITALTGGDSGGAMAIVVGALCCVMTPLFVSIGFIFATLSGSATYSVRQMMIPLFVVEGLADLGNMQSLLHELRVVVALMDANKGLAVASANAVVTKHASINCFIVFQSYLIQKIDNNDPMSWMAVFTPLIVYFSIQFFFVGLFALMRLHNIIEATCNPPCMEPGMLAINPALGVDLGEALAMRD